MSLEVKEKVSSLYDDELDASDHDHIITHLKNDTDVQDTWHRYGLIGDALKKNLPDNVEHNLFGRVQAAMESEPAHLISSAESTTKPDVADVVKITKKSSDKVSHPAWGFGIAASVALVSVLGFQMFSTGETSLQPEVASISPSVVTQELNIIAVEDAAIISVAEDATASAPTFAEQSVLDDGQWTRITPMDSSSLESDLLLNKPESRASIDFEDNSSSLARSVSLGKSSSE